MDLEIQTGKINFLEKEFQDLSESDKGNQEVSWYSFFTYGFALLCPSVQPQNLVYMNMPT